jgi:hypothetical protein
VTIDSTVPVELDPDMNLWLAQLDQDADDLVNDLLREYREQADDSTP